MCKDVQSDMLRADWVAAINRSNLQCVWWILCPGHACLRENERAGALAVGVAENEWTLTLDPSTVHALVRTDSG